MSGSLQSASALVRRYRRSGGIAASAANITARLATDPDAARLWTEGTDALGRALVTTTVLLDPQRIVLAGCMTAAGETLTDPVRRTLQRGLAWRTAPSLGISPLGADAGLLGAALPATDTSGLPPSCNGRTEATAGQHTPR